MNMGKRRILKKKMKMVNRKYVNIFILFFIFSMLTSCSTYKFYSEDGICYDSYGDMGNKEIFIPKKNNKEITKLIENKFEDYRITFLMFNKVNKIYYCEIANRSKYCCLEISESYNILSSKESYIEI